MLFAVRRASQIIVDNFGKIDSRHNAVTLRIHTDPVDPGNVKTCDVKSTFQLPAGTEMCKDPFPDRVLFVFQRSIHTAVRVAEIHAAKMADNAIYCSDQVALKIGFDEKRCKGVIDILSGRVDRNALHMRRFPQSGTDLTGEIRMDHNIYLCVSV